jgi:hypothetical protein
MGLFKYILIKQMNADQLKVYKREKSRLFAANLKALRLKDKANKQLPPPELSGDEGDGLTLADLLFKMEDLETKLDNLMFKLDILEIYIEP